MKYDLITRLSKLDAPDREVDWEIYQFFMGEWLHKHGYKREGDHYRTATPPVSGTEICSGPEYFTASVDAAIALAERGLPGCDWTISSNRQNEKPFSEIILTVEHGRSGYCGLGTTPAIAICIAILRAKETSNEPAQ
ncbi:hypothetical protein B3286c1_1762 [Brucella vulpis]|nr:hypothetical protein BF3285c1_1763 [Brucella vulpis]CUW50563.1 hypothetical protein B3286c1_1762 [Brucella vulpis]